jgi:predicted methyltransferase
MLKHLTLLLTLCLLPLGAPAIAGTDSERLATVLAAQPEERQARYRYRHPQETLEFFGIAPGMTVMEVLPGRGWYSPILVAYLGSDGHLVGADYPLELWGNFSFANEKFLAGRRAWADDFVKSAEEWKGDNGADATAVRLGSIPDNLGGTADAVLFIRALHNLNRFEDKGGFRTQALADAHAVLKPGGVVGVVQHMAPPGRSDDWANGSRGYLNKAMVIRQFEAAGFEFVASSEINRNPKDMPSIDDIVWRLPPSLNIQDKTPEKEAKNKAIGESNRMTLLFRKPAAS